MDFEKNTFNSKYNPRTGNFVGYCNDLIFINDYEKDKIIIRNNDYTIINELSRESLLIHP